MEQLRIIVFGAHPDDCDIVAGGTAALWAQAGHLVKLVAVTNGDAGHQTMASAALAQRRHAVTPKRRLRRRCWAWNMWCWTITTANCCPRWKIAAKSSV